MLSPVIYLMMNGLFFTLRLSGGGGSFPRPLKAAEEKACLERCAQGDLEARNILVEHNLRLVAHIVKKECSERRNFPGQKRPPKGCRISERCPAAPPPWCCLFLPRFCSEWWLLVRN